MDDTPSDIEQQRRALQEAIDSAKQAIAQTLDLIERTRPGAPSRGATRTLEPDTTHADSDIAAQGTGSPR
ncbi:hypothetical protein MAE02_35000 [Microvirga aerophila]|uniref:Uncharacterized protein n=1 Tax=Microvirga aerophila TaxID=670291 RepID=A0A512BV13_9HYPH|nr:hypothetical protein MAE02_35000 [Microvirga aerophila]